MENRKEDMMEHGKLFEAIRDTGAFEDVQVIAYDCGTPDIEVTIPSKCKFFALVHLNGDCSIDVKYKNYRHDERFDLDAYPMENGTRDYELPAGLTASEAAREIAFNAKMIA